ncbi:hypothetical protein VTO42DRAFT_5518 [Malbranchea cinnamomea]
MLQVRRTAECAPCTSHDKRRFADFHTVAVLGYSFFRFSRVPQSSRNIRLVRDKIHQLPIPLNLHTQRMQPFLKQPFMSLLRADIDVRVRNQPLPPNHQWVYEPCGSLLARDSWPEPCSRSQPRPPQGRVGGTAPASEHGLPAPGTSRPWTLLCR